MKRETLSHPQGRRPVAQTGWNAQPVAHRRNGPALPQWIAISPEDKREAERRRINCERIFPRLGERLGGQTATFFDAEGEVVAWNAEGQSVAPEQGLYLPEIMVERRENLRRLALAYEKTWESLARIYRDTRHIKGRAEAEKRLRRARAGRYPCPLDRPGHYFEDFASRSQRLLFLFEVERINHVDRVSISQYDARLRRFLWNMWHSERTAYPLHQGDVPLAEFGPLALIHRFMIAPRIT